MSIIISIKDKVSSDLALRDYAKSFFNMLEKESDEKITIDFANVTSISRSFAHEYLLNKQKIKKQIKETNIPSNIQKMFDIVMENTSKPKLIDVEKTQIITL